MTEIKLREARKAVYSSYHKDGIGDLMLGTTLLWFALLMYLEEAYIIGAILACWVPVYFALKEWITLPRIGFVKLRIRTATSMIIVVLLGLMILGMVFFIGTLLGWIPFEVFEVLAENAYLTIGAIIAGAILVIAIVYRVRRFYLYALLCILCLPLAGLLDIDLAVTITLLGAVIVAISLILLSIFLKEHPVKQPPVVENEG